jgi:CheY-like chemotaxis protein
MKIDYKVIWIDDKFEEEESPFTDIRDYLVDYLKTEHYFQVDIKTFENVENFKKAVIKDDFDLIITDYHLNDGKLGSEVIDFVRRENNISTEIFFYSAKQDLAVDTKLINNNRVTFYTLTGNSYRDLRSEIKNLIDLTLRKFNHIVAMRGMIMHETSNLDEKSIEIINEYFEKKSDVDISNALFDEIISFHKEKLGKAEKYKRNTRLDKIIKDPLIFSADKRANTLSNIIDKEGLVNFIADYKKEILLVRNQFAHAILDEEKQVFRTKGGEEFNEDLCKKIRKDINIHIDNINNLSSQLKANA